MEAQGVTEGGRVSRNLGYQDTTEKAPRHRVRRPRPRPRATNGAEPGEGQGQGLVQNIQQLGGAPLRLPPAEGQWYLVFGISENFVFEVFGVGQKYS